VPLPIWSRQFETWFKTIRLWIARVREEQFLLKQLRQFSRRVENLARLVREAFSRRSARLVEEKVTYIGKSVHIKGEVAGGEDLIIEGQMEGKIEMKDHNVMVGPHAKIKAQINANNVIVMGKVVGNIYARKLVEIKSQGSVVGDITSSRISTEFGARFKGSVDIQSNVDIAEQWSSAKTEPTPIVPNQFPGKLT